jgi:putative flippase GtrA
MLISPAGKKLIRFLIVGTSMAGFLMALTYVLIHTGLSPFWGGAFAYAISFVIAYTLQRFWTFEARQPHREAFPRYLLLQATCASSSGLFAHIAIDYLHMSDFWSAAVVTFIVTAMSFFGSLLWVFADTQADPREAGHE